MKLRQNILYVHAAVLLALVVLALAGILLLHSWERNRFAYAESRFSLHYAQALSQASSTAELGIYFRQAKTFFKRTTQGFHSAGFYVDVRAPKQTNYCLGEEIPIIWDASNNMESFRIQLYARGSYWTIAVVRATDAPTDPAKEYKGTYLWKVGDVQGQHAPWETDRAYIIRIDGNAGRGSFAGKVAGESKPFLITACEG